MLAPQLLGLRLARVRVGALTPSLRPGLPGSRVVLVAAGRWEVVGGGRRVDLGALLRVVRSAEQWLCGC